MRIEPRVFKNDDGTEKKSVVIICETDEESKILDSIGEPKEVGNYNYEVRGELRLSDGFREFYISLEADPYRYYREDLDFLGKLADDDSCEGICIDEPPYRDCPSCAAGALINEAGEILRDGMRLIKKEMKDG